MPMDGIDPDEVSWIAYWNATEHGADEIDPTDATDALKTFEIHSNGVEGLYEHRFTGPVAMDVTVRIKDDGWIIAFVRPTEAEGTNVDPRDEGLVGVHDVMGGWRDSGTNVDPRRNTLERVVKAVRDSLGNVAETTYDPTDVGLYNYQHDGETKIAYRSKAESVVQDESTGSWKVGATDDVEVKAAWIAASARTGSDAGTGEAEVYWEAGDETTALVGEVSWRPDEFRIGTRNVYARNEFYGGVDDVTIKWDISAPGANHGAPSTHVTMAFFALYSETDR